MTDDPIDPEDPRPDEHPERFRSNTWHYISDDLANSILLGPTADPKSGGDWLLTYTPERQNPEDREQVFVRLTPRALQRLYIEVNHVSQDARQAGHSVECVLCGEQVPLEDAVPNKREEPVHRRCYVDAYGGPGWME